MLIYFIYNYIISLILLFNDYKNKLQFRENYKTLFYKFDKLFYMLRNIYFLSHSIFPLLLSFSISIQLQFSYLFLYSFSFFQGDKFHPYPSVHLFALHF